jgi:ADP-ribose pyrophosphatase YjhB (NUDIX family)
MQPRLLVECVVLDQALRVLVLQTKAGDPWELPGDEIRPCEPPAAACARVLAQDLGLQSTASRFVGIDYTRPPEQGLPGSLRVLFANAVNDPEQTGRMSLGSGRYRAWELVPMNDIEDFLTDADVLRLVSCLARSNRAVYLEDGRRQDERPT